MLGPQNADECHEKDFAIANAQRNTDLTDQRITRPCQFAISCCVGLRQVHDNRNGPAEIDYEYTTEKGSTTVHEVTVTNSVKVAMDAKFEAFGVPIDISSSYQYTNVRQRPTT